MSKFLKNKLMIQHIRTGDKWNNYPDSPYNKWIAQKCAEPLIPGQKYETHHILPEHWFDKKIKKIPERDDPDNKIKLTR